MGFEGEIHKSTKKFAGVNKNQNRITNINQSVDVPVRAPSKTTLAVNHLWDWFVSGRETGEESQPMHQKMAGPSSSAVIGCPLQQEHEPATATKVHRGRVQTLQDKNTVDAQ